MNIYRAGTFDVTRAACTGVPGTEGSIPVGIDVSAIPAKTRCSFVPQWTNFSVNFCSSGCKNSFLLSSNGDVSRETHCRVHVHHVLL